MKKRTLLCLSVAASAMLLLSGCGYVYGTYYSVRNFIYRTWDMITGGPRRRMSRCCSNLKQLGLATVMYMDDHQRIMPSKDDLVKGQYMTDPECYRCPEEDAYEFVIPAGTAVNTPEFMKGRSPSGIEMIRCPVHGWTLYLGGNVCK